MERMSEYRVVAVLTEDRKLVLDDLPFQAGDAVEVVIVERHGLKTGKERYPFHGVPIQYERPFDPVAEDDWEVLDDIAGHPHLALVDSQSPPSDGTTPALDPGT